MPVYNGQKIQSSLGKQQSTQEGSYQLSGTLDFSLTQPLDLALTIGNSFDVVQSIFIDNSLNPHPIEIKSVDINPNAKIIAPERSQGWYVVPTRDAANLTFESDHDGQVQIIMSSLAIPPFVWYPDGQAQEASELNATVGNVSIATGQTESGSYTRGDKNVIGFCLQSAIDGGELEIQGSLDAGATWYSLYNSAAQKALYDVSLGAGIYYLTNLQEAEAVDLVRFVSSSAQTATRTIRPILRKLS